MTTQVPQRRAASPWSLPRRLMSGVARPGGEAMVRRALEGAALGEGDRVVELAPGLGLTSRAVLAARPRTWTGVEPDAQAAEHLRRAHGGPGRDVVEAPVNATGLPDGEASLVVCDGLLSTLDEEDRGSVLAEAARLLRHGGRIVLHELSAAPGADRESLARLADAGLAAPSEEGWRLEVERAGMVVVGSLVGRLDLPEQRELMRSLGPRGALRMTRGLPAATGAVAAALRTRQALERDGLALRSAVVVGEVPLILGMRRPRR